MTNEIFNPEDELMGNVVSDPNPQLEKCADKLFWSTGKIGYKLLKDRLGESSEAHNQYVEDMKTANLDLEGDFIQ